MMQASATLQALSQHESRALALVEQLQQLFNSASSPSTRETESYEPSDNDHVRRPEALRKSGISKSKQCALIHSGQFPKPHHTGAAAWWYRWELDDWLKKDEPRRPSDDDAGCQV